MRACIPRRRLATVIVAAVVCAPAATRAENNAYAGMAVSAAPAARECFRQLASVSGTLVPKIERAVRPEQDGLMVDEILVEPGDTVVAGQILARLTAPPGAQPATGVVKAPVAGVAVGPPVVVGTYAQSKASEPMFRIIQDGSLQLQAQALMSSLPLLRVGQLASIAIMGLDTLPGRVTAIDSSLDPTSQMGTVHLSVEQDPRVKSGAFARADIEIGEICQVAVPLSAVLYGPEGAVVQVIVEGHVETRRVAMGLIQKGRVQISSGVDPGDEVVVRSGGFLREGDPVRPVLPK